MVSVRLPIHVRSVATARTLLDKALHDLHQPTARSEDTTHPQGTARPVDSAPLTDSDIPHDAALMLSELVTNAVRHTHSLLWLDIHITGHTLRIEVADNAPDLPILRNPAPDSTNGRGMHIIDALADRWGTTHTPDHKTVWFELTLPHGH